MPTLYPIYIVGTEASSVGHKLSKKELAAVREVMRVICKNWGVIPQHCFANAQRAALVPSNHGYEMLYHEGFFHAPLGRMKHAWNTLNGKLVDVSSSVPMERLHEVAHLYETTGTYTPYEVVMKQIENNQMMIFWLNDPDPTNEKEMENLPGNAVKSSA